VTPPERPTPRRGLYEDQFWAYVAGDGLHLQRSKRTGQLRYPPSAVCPDTLDPAHDWVPLSGCARLIAWTTFRRTYFPTMPAPYTVVVVQADEGPLFVGHLGGDCSDALRHGMAMGLTYDQVTVDGEAFRLFNWVPDHQEVPVAYTQETKND